LDIGSETIWEKGHSAKKCRSKTASDAGIAERLAQISKKFGFVWAMCQIGSGETIQVLPCPRGLYYYTRQAGLLTEVVDQKKDAPTPSAGVTGRGVAKGGRRAKKREFAAIGFAAI
jgi:hypothetical protein